MADTVRKDWVRLAGYSFLILFLELALIRYLPAYVRVFGFYVNFVLIATFLGMGVGLLRADSARRLAWLAIPALLLLFGAVKYFSNVRIEAPQDPDEYLWLIYFEAAPAVRRIGMLPVVGILFVACTSVFIPLGALLGREFRKLPPLQAYSVDIAGSLAGILLFGAASSLQTEPLVWFGFGLVVWLLLSLGQRPFAAAFLPVSLLVLGLVSWTRGTTTEYWSPYYRINLFPGDALRSVIVNGSLHQYIIDLDPETARREAIVGAVRRDYQKPFDLVDSVDSALVVGSGTGNDVALLLERGARRVDAVEIDPTILELGRVEHPQSPYSDPRVHAHVDDARAFFRKSERLYDVIVFGTLDSQTLLSGMSSVRLDNYVYTVEAFRAARARLKKGGKIVAYHMSGYPWIAAKIYRILQTAFGKAPRVLYEPRPRLFNYTFVAPAPGAAKRPESLPRELLATVDVPHDDWPYLYLRSRTVPAHYLGALGIVLLVSLLAIGAAAGRRLRRGFDGAMFCMGAGFLLVETKSVTEMSLLFGSTWSVNLLVFASILTMILVANCIVARAGSLSPDRFFAGLFAALGLAFALPVRELLWLGLAGQWMAGGLMVALPVFFAAMIFATLFRSRQDTTRALAMNLLGAIAGGIAEYAAMILGIKALYLLAAAAYGGAWLFCRRGLRRPMEPLPSVAPLAVPAQQAKEPPVPV
ncbi:MAG: hypothetical protein ACE5F1_14145 [Planctomycetota bacterium]